jgi:threonine/homoserine/homoserine lactone efflux protein
MRAARAAPVFAPRPMPRERAARLFGVGLATAALNPKVALFYMAVLPPFIDPARGEVFVQGAVLGAVQIGVAVVFDALLVLDAGGVACFLGARPSWMAAQRWILGGALGLLAAKLATEGQR